MSLAEIDRLLQLSKHHDKDERFMATNDMIMALDGLDNIDRALQARITDAILCQFNDQSSDVQSVAVKCLSIIVPKFSLDQIITISQRLSELVFIGNPELRDIYSIGIRTIVNSLPPHSNQKFSSTLVPLILAGIRSDANSPTFSSTTLPSSVVNAPLSLDIQLVCIDLLRDVLKRFGDALPEYHDTISKQLLNLLNSNGRFALQKRVLNTFGALAPILPPERFEKMFSVIIDQIEHFGSNSLSGNSLYNYIQCIGVICRVAALSVSPWIPRVVPLLVQVSSTDSKPLQIASQQGLADDLRETCIQAMEAIFKSCPNDSSPFYSEMLSACCAFAKYDPNFIAQMDTERTDDGGEMVTDDGFDDGDWGDEVIGDEFNDVNDQSFKVRKSAFMALSAFIANARNEYVDGFFAELLDTIYRCIRDRDITVKTQAFLTFSQLLKTCHAEINSVTFMSTLPMLSNALTREKDEQILLQVFEIIREFARIKQIEESQLFLTIPMLLNLFESTTASPCIRHGIICCFSGLLSRVSGDTERRLHDSPDLASHLPNIAQAGISQLANDSARMRSDAIGLCGLLVEILTAKDSQIILQLYKRILEEFMLQDVDQRIKEASMKAISIIIFKSGDLDPASVAAVFQIIDSRLNNEVTQLSALDAVIRIAKRTPPLDLGVLTSSASLNRLCSFLRKNSSSLRYQSAQAIMLCINGRLNTVGLENAKLCIGTLLNYIDCGDLQLCDLILYNMLEFVQSILNSGLVLDSFIDYNDFISRCSALLKNSSLPNMTLNALSLLMQCLATKSPQSSKFSKDSLFQSVLDTNCSSCSVSTVKNQSFLLAAIICCQPSDQAPALSAVVDVLLPGIRSKSPEERLRSLHAVGLVGERVNLQKIEQLPSQLLQSFDDTSDECKIAASVALGKLSIGSHGATMPLIVKQMSTNDRHRYLILNSFKQMLVSLGQTTVDLPDDLVPMLITFSYSDDEGVRNILSQCLGLLFANPEVNKLVLSSLKSPSANVRSVMMGTLRYISPTIDLSNCLDDFIELLSDDDLSTRRHALIIMNALLKDPNRRTLLAKIPDFILPHVILQTQIDPSLIRMLDFGPFKQKIDDGIPLRRAAFSCLESLALHHTEYIQQYSELDAVLCRGLSDEQDVQLTVYHILLALCSKVPDCLLSLLPQLISGFLDSIKDQLRLAKTEATQDASVTILRTAVRLFITIRSHIPKAMLCKEFQEFIVRVERTSQLAELMKEVSGFKSAD